MLKLDKQIGDTIYWPILAANEAYHLEGVGAILEGWVQYICLVGCRLPPLDGYVAACLVLTIEIHGLPNLNILVRQFNCLYLSEFS